jgi:hypothetical protein
MDEGGNLCINPSFYSGKCRVRKALWEKTLNLEIPKLEWENPSVSWDLKMELHIVMCQRSAKKWKQKLYCGQERWRVWVLTTGQNPLTLYSTLICQGSKHAATHHNQIVLKCKGNRTVAGFYSNYSLWVISPWLEIKYPLPSKSVNIGNYNAYSFR